MSKELTNTTEIKMSKHIEELEAYIVGSNDGVKNAALTLADTARKYIDKVKELEESQELAWGLIANAWDVAGVVSGWTEAAERWRDEHYNPSLDKEKIEEVSE